MGYLGNFFGIIGYRSQRNESTWHHRDWSVCPCMDNSVSALILRKSSENEYKLEIQLSHAVYQESEIVILKI
jgi:hypothetical protein